MANFEVSHTDKYGTSWVHLGCVKHRKMYLAEVEGHADCPYVAAECDECFDEASWGCSLEELVACDVHGMTVGPNRSCCEKGREKFYAAQVARQK